MKSITIVVSMLLSLLMLTGCTLYQWQTNPVNEKKYVKKVVFTDNVVASFRWHDLKISSEGAGDNKVALPADGIGFSGEKYIYFLTKGADALEPLDKYMQKYHFVSGYSADALQFELTRKTDAQTDGAFSDAVLIKIEKDKRQFTPDEIAEISRLGFSDGKKSYYKYIEISGVFIDKRRIKSDLQQPETFSQSYKIEFYTNEMETSFSALNLVGNAISTPLTLAGDIIIVPVGLAVMAASPNH
ncbi:hypothetical protein FJU30_17750 [Affinibrenneria salicis]|uniref:Lipoprotein n=1 Tax=Affinibrenneria salicis TaxID=2590031 RepID=A0A5J5FVF0_9GAMM|nr:hypothetical protein [Affinibrenneria salicis]KAA8997620.1 hypothetical protein FJU30_17750 [Affinibrenneria salicis]